MAQTGRFLTLAALLAVAAQATELPPNELLVPEDTTVSNQADEAVTLYCAGGWKGDHPDKAALKEQLVQGAGGSNILLEAMEDSESQADMSNQVSDKITPMFLFWKAVPLVFAFLLLIIWFMVCWTAWPWKKCCKCCRCCVRERKTHVIAKFVVLVIMISLAIAVVIAGSMASDGFNQSVDGFDNMACTSASILNATLQGTNNPPFIGMMPLLNTFWILEKELDTGSDFLNSLGDIMANTAPISQATYVATQTLDLLSDMMNDPHNQRPQDATGPLYHKCTFCENLVAPLQQTSQALTDGLGSALANAREEVDSQLTPSARADLQANIRTSTAPLNQVKTSVRDTFSFFVDKDKFIQVKDMLNGVIFLGVIMVILIGILIMGCGTTSASCFLCCERTSSRYVFWKKKNADAQNKNPYNKFVHRCACCTWCSAWFYCILTFFVGGLLNAIGVPMSSMCLIMDDLNSQMLHDIGPALGMNLEGDEGEMMVDMIDQCFVPENRTLNAYLLDILYTRENGEKVTMRQKIVDEVKNQIQAQFDGITSNNEEGDLATNADVVGLRDMIRLNPIDTMIIADDEHDWDADVRYKDMADDPRGDTNGLVGVIASSAACTSHTIAGGMPGEGDVIFGVNELADRLQAVGDPGPALTPEAADPAGTCVQNVDCDDLPSSTVDEIAKKRACEHGNNFVDLKRRIIQLTTYKCDLFEDPQDPSQYCDPFDMVGPDANGMYSNDCLNNGVLTRKQRTCTLDEFTTYVSRFDERIDKVMTRIDAMTDRTFTGINVNLRNLVAEHITDPIEDVANGVRCGFLARFYREMVEGLCFQGIIGFRTITACYLACAILSFFMIVLQYVLWRRTLDNFNSFSSDEVYAMN